MARILASCHSANQLRIACRPSKDKQLIGQLARLSKSIGLRTPPNLSEMDGQCSPLLVGIIRPAIVLPATILGRLDAAEWTLVISHELAHMRRHDLLWSLVGAVVRALFFFHPLAWLSERRLRLTQEIAADELAITLQKYDSVIYATLLVSVISKLAPGQLTPTMSVGFTGSNQSLNRRFAAMRFMKPVSRHIVIAYGIVLGLVAVLGVVPWTIVAAEVPKSEKTKPKEARFSGKFLSFMDGVLKIQGDDGKEFDRIKVAENTRSPDRYLQCPALRLPLATPIRKGSQIHPSDTACRS